MTRNCRFELRLSKDELSDLTKKARKAKLTNAALIRRAIRAWQKILCRRFSTKVKNGAVKQGGFWLNSPSLHHSRQCTAVCMPQA